MIAPTAFAAADRERAIRGDAQQPTTRLFLGIDPGIAQRKAAGVPRDDQQRLLDRILGGEISG